MKILTQLDCFLTDRHVVQLTSCNEAGETRISSVNITSQFQSAALLMETRIDYKHDNERLHLWTCCHKVVDDANLEFISYSYIHHIINDNYQHISEMIALCPRGMKGGMQCTLHENFQDFQTPKAISDGFHRVLTNNRFDSIIVRGQPSDYRWAIIPQSPTTTTLPC